jgi:SAM-dependent methyltransferase
MSVKTEQISDILDQVDFRERWIQTTFVSLRAELLNLGCLDLGAGKKPYEKFIRDLGISYTSHDFAQYSPADNEMGLQDPDWPVDGYDIVCDILDVEVSGFDIVLLTEVLEHVVNPTNVLRVAFSSIRANGFVVASVPFNSRMHQAPHWYSSGLSEFYFKALEEELGFECLKIIKVGDFIDYWIQETTICLSPFPRFQKTGTKIIQYIGGFLRKKLDPQLMTSGGLNLLVLLRKK